MTAGDMTVASRSRVATMSKLTVLLFVGTLFSLLASTLGYPPMCCTTDQWEAELFLDKVSAHSQNPAFLAFSRQRHPLDDVMLTSYTNATLHVAYDWKNQRTRVNVSEAEFSNESPKPQLSAMVIISDYNKGKRFLIQNDTCRTSSLGNMSRQCVPSDADFSGVNYFGINSMTTVAGYSYNMTSLPLQVTVRIGLEQDCNPVTALYRDVTLTSQALALMNIEVVNFDPFISNPAIFDVPAICKSAAEQMERSPVPFLYQPL